MVTRPATPSLRVRPRHGALARVQVAADAALGLVRTLVRRGLTADGRGRAVATVPVLLVLGPVDVDGQPTRAPVILLLVQVHVAGVGGRPRPGAVPPPVGAQVDRPAKVGGARETAQGRPHGLGATRVPGDSRTARPAALLVLQGVAAVRPARPRVGVGGVPHPRRGRAPAPLGLPSVAAPAFLATAVGPVTGVSVRVTDEAPIIGRLHCLPSLFWRTRVR